jgi:PAS domain S-box-containing protein
VGPSDIVDPEESERETLRAALEILPTGLVILDAGGHIIRASRVVEQQFRYWLDELVGAPIEMLVPELGPEALAPASAGEHGGGQPVSMTGVTGLRRDGSELSLDVTVLATRADDPGATIIVLEQADDARSRHRIAILEAFVEASDDAVFSQNQDGEVTSWNLSAERIFGYPAGEIVGLPAAALFPEHLRADAELVFASATDGNKMNHIEIEMQRKDGMPFPASLSLSLVRDPNGVPVSCVVLARDITEQRLAQATLAEMEARVHESERLAHVGSWGWDLRTGAVQWTDELHRIHDVDPFEFAGTIDAYLAAIHTDDRVRVHDAMMSAVTSLRSFETEYRVVTSDGSERRVYVQAEPMTDSAGAVIGLRGIGRDVSSRPG